MTGGGPGLSPAPVASDPAGRWSSRWHRATGLVLSAYLLFYLVQLAFLRRNPTTFDRMTGWSASLGARLVAAGVVTALVFHALDGLRIVVLEVVGASSRAARRSRHVVVFATALSVLPLAALVLRPCVSG